MDRGRGKTAEIFNPFKARVRFIEQFRYINLSNFFEKCCDTGQRRRSSESYVKFKVGGCYFRHSRMTSSFDLQYRRNKPSLTCEISFFFKYVTIHYIVI